MGFIFPVLLLAMGAYVLYGAIKGEGKLFSMENFKDESMDQAKKIMRGLYFGIAAIMLFLALANALSTVLYTNKLTYLKITDEYTKAFPDLVNENGQLLKVNSNGAFEKDENGNVVLMADADGKTEAYNIANEKMDQNVAIGGFIQNAYYVYGKDTNKFPQVASTGLGSCMGGSSVDYAKYYKATDRVDDNDNPLYGDTTNGHIAYVSYFSKTRSDANDGSFVTKLYGAFSQTLLTVLNYVFLGIAILAVVAIFLVTRKFTDKEKLQKAREQQVRPAMPSDAFNFDDEPKQSDAKDK